VVGVLTTVFEFWRIYIMKKNSRDWNKVLKNLDKEFPEPVMNEVIQMPYDPDVSLTDIEVAENELDVATLLNTIDKPRLKRVVEDRYLNRLTVREVAASSDLSAARISQLEWKALVMIRKSQFS
jgi:DNA-directed RNA polymerase specialized sigma subunit